MPPIAPLNPQQIADLYGAIDDFVGTGNNILATFNTTFFPVVIEKVMADDLIGLGDGIATSYNTNFFCDSPRTIQGLKLFRTTVSVPANQLTIVTHYTVNTLTGAITLTPAGVAFLGLEQLHATYTIPSTVELHKGTVTGPLLTETTHYTIVSRSGKITLTAAGITFLALSQLHAKYYTEAGSINFIDEDTGGMGAARVQLRIRKLIVYAKDQDLRSIHEAIETKAILNTELERRYLIGTYVAPGEVITEALLIQNVQYAYRATPFTGAPLFPPGVFPPPANPALPDLTAAGLSGGTGFDPANESSEIATETAQYASIIDGHADTNPVGWALRFLEPATSTMLAAIASQQTALTNQIAAIAAFLTDNPVPNDHVSAGNIADATAASAAASARFAANAAYVPTVTAAPHSGLSNAQILSPTGARYLASTARSTFITTTRMAAQITPFLTFLWSRRSFWISERARLGDGTLSVYDQTVKGDARIGTLLSQNAVRRQSILDIILAQ